jgi:hypothetical protein
MQEVISNAPNTPYRSSPDFQRGDRRRIFLDFYSIVPRRHTRICRKTTSQREKWPSRESGVEKHLYGEINGITSEHAIRAILARLQAVKSHDVELESYKVDISIALLRAVEGLSTSPVPNNNTGTDAFGNRLNASISRADLKFYCAQT